MSGSGSIVEMMMNETMMNVTESTCRSANVSTEDLLLLMGNNTFWSIGENRQTGSLIVGILILLFFLVGSIWNLFIIITFFAKFELLNEPANIFLLNLAFTDLITCLTTMVFIFVTSFAQEFIFGPSDAIRCILCDIAGFFLVFLIFVSLHLLMALSIDRFILLSRPLRYKQLMKRWKALLICAIIYVVCFILAILPHAGIVGEVEFNPRLATCLPRFTPMKNFYWVIFLAFEALIPIFVLAFTNVWTYRLVSKFLKKNFRRKSTYRRKGREGDKSQNKEDQKHKQQQKQLVKVFSALLISNIISYTPTVLAIIIMTTGVLLPSEVYIIGFVSFLTSPVFHPIIESFFVKELRYQVSRAKHGVRRVSTSIYRGTTQLFSAKMLEEANKSMEDKDTQVSTRSIQFLNGRKAAVNNTFESSCVTEMETLPNSRSPSLESEDKDNEGTAANNNTTTTTTTESAAAGDDDDMDPKGFDKLKSRRSVTFSTTSETTSLNSPSGISLSKAGGAGGQQQQFGLQQGPPNHNHHAHAHTHTHAETIAEVSGTLERGVGSSSYHNGNRFMNGAESVTSVTDSAFV